MKAHKRAIIITICIAVVSVIGWICLECYTNGLSNKPDWKDTGVGFFIGIICSDLVVLGIEISNYFYSIEILMFEFCFESGRIVDKFKNLRYCLQEKSGDFIALRKVYIEICDLDIYTYFLLHNSFDFLCLKNKYYGFIHRIAMPIKKFHEIVKSKDSYLKYNDNDGFVNQLIEELNDYFEKVEVIREGGNTSERLTDILESIENEITELQKNFFKLGPVA